MGELNTADRQIYIAIRRVLLQLLNIIEVRLGLEPTQMDLRRRYRREREDNKATAAFGK